MNATNDDHYTYVQKLISDLQGAAKDSIHNSSVSKEELVCLLMEAAEELIYFTKG